MTESKLYAFSRTVLCLDSLRILVTCEHWWMYYINYSRLKGLYTSHYAMWATNVSLELEYRTESPVTQRQIFLLDNTFYYLQLVVRNLRAITSYFLDHTFLHLNFLDRSYAEKYCGFLWMHLLEGIGILCIVIKDIKRLLYKYLLPNVWLI